MNTKSDNISIELQETGRLDKVLAKALSVSGLSEAEGLSRARVQQLIKNGKVVCAGVAVCDPNAAVQLGQVYDIEVPPPVAAEPEAQDIPLDILYEDADLLVINKPVGLVVHPAAGHRDSTLVNALLAHCGQGLSGIGGVARPGIVHRLDKETSGLMVVAKNDMAHQGLTAQFADRSLSRVYQTVVWGLPKPLKGEIEGAIGRHPRSRQKMAVVSKGGKEALTYYETKQAFANIAALVECHLATGRTHQIRVHMAHMGHPVVGDPLYGERRARKKAVISELQAFPRQALHAGEIKFIHPRTKRKLNFKASMPEDMASLLKILKKMPMA
jgi:23S rRNA pseudouridine1911/1915/1917 synthase